MVLCGPRNIQFTNEGSCISFRSIEVHLIYDFLLQRNVNYLFSFLSLMTTNFPSTVSNIPVTLDPQTLCATYARKVADFGDTLALTK